MAYTYRRMSDDTKRVEEVEIVRDPWGNVKKIRTTTYVAPEAYENANRFRTEYSKQDSGFEEVLRNEKRLLRSQIMYLKRELEMLEDATHEERLTQTAQRLRKG